MIRIFSILLIVLIFFSSCSTLIHQRTVNLYIYSDTDSVKVSANDILKWFNTPTIINVERSKKDLLITAKKDSIQRSIKIKSRLSAAFWLGNLINGAGIFGYAIDLTNSKRFTYPKYITIKFNDSTEIVSLKYQKWLPPIKNIIAFKISIPEGNHFYLNKVNGYGSTFGFLGISYGFEYYFKDKYSINIDIGTLTDFMIPIPAPVDYMGNYQRSFATYGDIQIGSDIKRFHFDLGLQYNRTTHYERETVELYPNYKDTLKYFKEQNNIGLAFSTYFRISQGFNIGINYYPSIVAWDNSKLQVHYSHIMFFELIFRIEANRNKIKKQMSFLNTQKFR